VRYKKPVEYSFYVWINGLKEDYEPVGADYFINFCKNVTYHNAKKWKNSSYLRERILKEFPEIDLQYLDDKLSEFETCMRFHEAIPYQRGYISTSYKMKSGYYEEHEYKKEKFVVNEKPIR